MYARQVACDGALSALALRVLPRREEHQAQFVVLREVRSAHRQSVEAIGDCGRQILVGNDYEEDALLSQLVAWYGVKRVFYGETVSLDMADTVVPPGGVV